MVEKSLKLRAGELVEVRTWEEILPTLDQAGAMDRLPFMPEMKSFCGKQFRVHARADRTCVEHHKARGMDDTVWLRDVRCDGSDHDGCKVGCQIFWKEAWLKRVPENAPEVTRSQGPSDRPPHLKQAGLPVPGRIREEDTGRYICQSSELANATYPLGVFGNLRTYFYDLQYGNLSMRDFIKGLYIYVATRFRTRSWKQECGTLLGQLKKTPSESLNLQPGDWVEVKTTEEIATTLDALGRNRGLLFTKELLEFCGKRYRVLQRLDKAINERNGEMITLNNTVLLEGTTCNGICRRGCKRNGHNYFREIWLKKVD
jgi:hypothetical protein